MTIGLDPKLKEKDSMIEDYKPTPKNRQPSYIPPGSENNVQKQKLKNELFAREYIRNGLNARSAMKVVSPELSDSSLTPGASAMLSKKAVQEILLNLLPPVEEDVKLIQKAYAAKLPENIAFKDVYKYLELSMRLKGLIDDKKDQTDVKIGLVIEN